MALGNFRTDVSNSSELPEVSGAVRSPRNLEDKSFGVGEGSVSGEEDRTVASEDTGSSLLISFICWNGAPGAAEEHVSTVSFELSDEE